MAAEILAAQKDLGKSIVNFLVNTKQKKASKTQTVSYFRARLKLLEGYWARFLEQHARLVPFAKELRDDAYFSADLYHDVEYAY